MMPRSQLLVQKTANFGGECKSNEGSIKQELKSGTNELNDRISESSSWGLGVSALQQQVSVENTR